MNAPVVIVGCGAAKVGYPAPARSLYVGSYFTMCLSAAEALTTQSRVFILSARYGLLPVASPVEIEPYDLTMGEPGSVDARQLAAQAVEHGISDEPVIVLCGARYAALVRQVWSHVSAPLAGLGIGKQRHVLSVLRAGGSVL